jgi:tetratricopeptide (TPR) repeat protein
MTNNKSCTLVSNLFKKGNEYINNKKYKKAVDLFKKVLSKEPNCIEAWNNLGLAYCELGRFDDALQAYNKIDDKLKNAVTWFNTGIVYYCLNKYYKAIEAYEKSIKIDNINNPSVLADAMFNLGLIFFELGDIENACKNVEYSLKQNNNSASCWALKGKIFIENDECDKAIIAFNKAISLDKGSNLTFQVWEVYARYLQGEFSGNNEERKRKLISVIRKLERVDTLARRKQDCNVRAYTLYFLAYLYCKQDDHFTAKKKLQECIQLKTKTPVRLLAKELLENLWDIKIRPSWWRWWLIYTVNPHFSVKRFLFFFISSILTLTMMALFFHPFIGLWFPSLQKGIHWELYLFLCGFLVITLLSPSIEQFKAKDIEIKIVQAPISLEITPSPAQMESTIGNMRIMHSNTMG